MLSSEVYVWTTTTRVGMRCNGPQKWYDQGHGPGLYACNRSQTTFLHCRNIPREECNGRQIVEALDCLLQHLESRSTQCKDHVMTTSTVLSKHHEQEVHKRRAHRLVSILIPYNYASENRWYPATTAFSISKPALRRICSTTWFAPRLS
jgi:hypothetical protein